MSWIKDLFTGLTSLFCRAPEVQVQQWKQGRADKMERRYWKNRFLDIFADANIEELTLMKNLVDSDNQFQITCLDIDDETRKVKVGGIEENLYQSIDSLEGKDVYDLYQPEEMKVRITVTVFKQFKKKFNKYGRPRIPFDETKECKK